MEASTLNAGESVGGESSPFILCRPAHCVVVPRLSGKGGVALSSLGIFRAVVPELRPCSCGFGA